jgi:hypothetical protein
VIAEATKILEETSPGTVMQIYVLFQVVSSMLTRAGIAGVEVITSVKRLAKATHSAIQNKMIVIDGINIDVKSISSEEDAQKATYFAALAQLASRIGAVMKHGAADGDDVLSKAKRSELNRDIAKMTAKIDQAAARSATLKEEVTTLENELGSGISRTSTTTST